MESAHASISPSIKELLGVKKNLFFNVEQEDGDVIKKTDLISFQESFNTSFSYFRNEVQSELLEFKKIIYLIPELKGTIEKLTIDNKCLKDGMAELKGELLICKEERKKEKTRVDQLSKEIKSLRRNSITSELMNNEVDAIKLKISSQNETIDELTRRLKEIPEVKIITETNKEWENKIKQLETDMETLKAKSNSSPVNIQNNKQRIDANDEFTINEEFLILGDSNTKNINVNKLNKFGETKKIFCPLFESILERCDKFKIRKQPAKIFIHCGTNDLDKMDALELINKIDLTIEKLHVKFPTSTIVISSLIPRRQGKFDEVIENINNYIRSLSAKFNFINIMNNKKVDKKMLCDDKHLNKDGFFVFLTNIKFVLYGEIPYISRHQNKNNFRRNWDHRRSSNNNNRHHNRLQSNSNSDTS